jgi:hypothetical protein
VETSAQYSGTHRSFTDRMLAAARLDISLYEEVEADTTATQQAALVIAMAAVAGAVGWSGEGAPGIFIALVAGLAGWAIWAGLTYLIGSFLFHGTATWGELARTLGFAQSPALLNVLGIIPLLGGLVRFVVWIWLLIAGIIAIRQALDITTGKAIAVAVIGWLLVAIPTFLAVGIYARTL